MRVMVLVKASAASEAGEMPGSELMTAMTEFNEALAAAGVLLAGEGLRPTSAGARVHIEGTERRVSSGPFSGTGDLVSGFWIWKVASLDEAIDWAKRCPNPYPGDGAIEIRPIFEIEDFADVLGPDLLAREEALTRRP